MNRGNTELHGVFLAYVLIQQVHPYLLPWKKQLFQGDVSEGAPARRKGMLLETMRTDTLI